MSRSQDERQPVREGVLNSNRSVNPAMSVANMEKEKHDSQLAAKINSGIFSFTYTCYLHHLFGRLPTYTSSALGQKERMG